MAIYTQDEIDGLIACPKTVSDPPKRTLRLVGADWRNDMKLVASDPMDGDFSVFMRKSDDFAENFSVGLMYHPRDGRPEITLLRCNGQHGAYNGSPSSQRNHWHWNYHIYKASELALDEGFTAEKYAERTEQFASYEEAVEYFVKAISLAEGDIEKHFPKRTQRSLFD